MVGEGVLHEALQHSVVESVLVIGRRSCGVRHEKLQEVVRDDLSKLSDMEERLRGYNACFFCLGVSSIGMTEKDYTRITYDLTIQVATTLASVNPDMTFCYVSGAGTDSTERGRSMWARVKGKTENDLGKLPFKAAYMFRPGFIRPTKGLKNAFMLARVLGGLYPMLRIVFPSYVCTMQELGRAMIRAAASGASMTILENRNIVRHGQAGSTAGG